MRVGPVWTACLLLLGLISCNTNTPTPPTPTTVPAVPLPTSTVLSTPSATTTTVLAISLVTPTPQPTDLPPLPTDIITTSNPVTDTSPVAGAVTPSSPIGPAEVGQTAADAGLVAVLQNCWHVSDPRQLNGNVAEQRNAFDCARASLASIAQTYPTYGLVHRVIAWGYYYKDNDVSKAVEEYRKAAAIYHQNGDRAGESETRLRLGLLLVSSSRSQACGELAQAANLDPTNDRSITYYNAYQCSTAGNLTSGGTPVAAPVLEANLDQVRGKILFKSDRDGFQSFYVMDPDGNNQKQVASNLYSTAVKWESWPPDHSQVAVVRSTGFTRKFGFNNDIWITDPSGGSGRALANPADDYDPAWSPAPLFDGQFWIAFVSNRGDIAHGNTQGEEIWAMHSDGTSTLRLTCHGPSFSKHPSWSADSSRLVLYSNYPSQGNSQIYAIDATKLGSVSDPCQVGDTAKNLSNNQSNDTEPVWVK